MCTNKQQQASTWKVKYSLFKWPKLATDTTGECEDGEMRKNLKNFLVVGEKKVQTEKMKLLKFHTELSSLVL